MHIPSGARGNTDKCERSVPTLHQHQCSGSSLLCSHTCGSTLEGMLQMCPVLITEAAESGGSEDHPVNCGGKSITGAADLPEQRRVYTSRL